MAAEKVKIEKTYDSPFIGKTLSTYNIISKIGAGGMSNVFIGRNLNNGSLAAIKVLKKQYTQDEENVNKFFSREVKITKSLHHKNIVSILDFGRKDDNYFIIYELIEGITLDKYIKNNKVSIENAENILLQLLSGLSYAHSLAIIHRDIKPQNIMITHKGEVKLTDFGIAKALSSATVTQTGVFMGSPGYISPEQADPTILKGEKIDKRTDIYSLGILIFELLSGRIPFTSETPWGIVNKHLNEPVPDIKRFNSSIPDYMVYIVNKCLEKNRKNRFSDVEKIIEIIKLKRYKKPSHAMINSDNSTRIIYPEQKIGTAIYGYCKKCGNKIMSSANQCDVCGEIVQAKRYKDSITPHTEIKPSANISNDYSVVYEGKRQLVGIKIILWINFALTLLWTLISTTTMASTFNTIQGSGFYIFLTIVYLINLMLVVIALTGISKRKSYAVIFTRIVLIIFMFYFPVGTILGAIFWHRMTLQIVKNYLNYH
ncbi:MAG: serine/threonine-protein kinase [Candidatus Humimicrobiaceae bacterium]